MRFMLDEYDALPLGLLRHGKKSKKLSETGAPIPSPPVGSPSPGEVGGADKEAPMFVHCSPPPEQKVMPLDKVRITHIRCRFTGDTWSL